MRTRFKKIWCDDCETMHWSDEFRCDRREVPTQLRLNCMFLFQLAHEEAVKIDRPLLVSMDADCSVYPPQPK